MVPLENSSGDSVKNKLYPKRAKEDSDSVITKGDKFLEGLISSVSWSPDWIQEPYGWAGHMPFAYWLMGEIQPKVFVELGTHTGNSYFSFCQAVRDKGLTGRCFAVDTWNGDEQAGFYGGDVFELVNQHNESQYKSFSTLYRMTFDEALAKFDDKSIDLLHIDGLHTYEAVRHDFETWLPKLAPGALVLFHDIKVSHGVFGVWKLWAELKQKYPQNFEFRHSHGLGVIKLPGSAREDDLVWLREGTAEKKILLEVMSANGESLMAKARHKELERLASAAQTKVNKPEIEKPLNLELFFAQEGEQFFEEKKISEPVLYRENEHSQIRIQLQGKATRAVLWRIDLGDQPGLFRVHELGFTGENSKKIWRLTDHSDEAVIGGSAERLSGDGFLVCSFGKDPQISLPKLSLSADEKLYEIRITLEALNAKDYLPFLATRYHELESQSRSALAKASAALEQKEKEAARMKSILEAKEKEIARATKIDQQIEQIRQEMAAGREESKLVVKKVEREWAQQRKTQQEAVEKPVSEVKREIVAEIQSLIANLVEQEEKNRFEASARIGSVKEGIEGRIIEVGEYVAKIQNAVVAPSSYLIPTPFSWYNFLYKMLSIRKPIWLNKEKESGEATTRPGFWRRLERSIRKRRKRWIAGIGFDRDWYLKEYPDVKKCGMDAFEHYIKWGEKENRKRNKKEYVAEKKVQNPDKLANQEKSHTAIVHYIQKNKIKKNKEHKLPFKPSLIIGVSVYKENESVQQLIKSLEICLEEINNQNALIVFINDYPEDIPLRQKLELTKDFEKVSHFEDNSTNEGFLKTGNIFFEMALANKCDIILLNSDTIVFPGAITELINIAKSDPQIGFVSPRSNNASLCSWPIELDGISTWNSSEWFKYHQEISKSFPKLQVIPVCCGFCLYIKWSILDDLGGFDELYGKGYEEENDLILRANIVGYKAVVANYAFVWHKGSASFKHLNLKTDERKKLNFQKICKRYPNYPEIITSYFQSPSYRAEILLGNTKSNKNNIIYIGQDLLGLVKNGTSEIAVNIYKEIQKLDNLPYQFVTYISNDAAQYHKIKGSKNLLVVNNEKEIPFCKYGLHLSQPFHSKTIEIIFTKCLITSFWMLDTIADDCFQLKNKMVSRMWQYSADFSDKIFGISRYSCSQFTDKFSVDAEKAQSILLSCQSTMLQNENYKKKDFQKYILIFGNKFDHKFVRPTIQLLKENEIDEKIIVFGLEGISTGKVQFIKSGNLSEFELEVLIGGALFVIYPSIVEGFGLPVRDVPHLGVPIICRELPSFVEIRNNLSPEVRRNIFFYSSNSSLIELIKKRTFLIKEARGLDFPANLSKCSWESQFTQILQFLTACRPKNYTELKRRMFYLETF